MPPTPVIPVLPEALRLRRRESEWMDDPALEPALHREALRGLGRLNGIGGAARLVWPHVKRELAEVRGRLTLVDAGCGSGDVAEALQRRARGGLRIFGIDSSATALAEARARGIPGADFVQADLLGEWPAALPERPDIILCGLVLHHLDPPQIERLLVNWAGRTTRLVLVSDLRRAWSDWWLVWAAARLVTRSPVVHRDSALSVQAAFTRGEWRAMLRHAGMESARIERALPCRWIIAWRPEVER